VDLACSPEGRIRVIDDHSSRFTLSELVEASGVSARTIRYYISKQLVSQALGRGRSRYFTSEHLREVAYVARLREQHFSVDEIRDQMAQEVEPASPATGETWERLELHAGLELSIRSDVPENVRALARELQVIARDWFGDERADASRPGPSADVQLDR
jgi:DNA-binding transcriptional MerR regulator